MIKEGILPYNPGAEAVADAMMVAQARLLNGGHFTYPDDPELLGRLERKLHRDQEIMKRTRDKCLTGVSIVLDHLTRKHTEKFSTLVALVAIDDIAPLRGGWGTHFYFLTKDVASTWCAGSPANHLTIEDPSRLTNLICSESLDTVLDQIQTMEHGLWPNAHYIEQVANDPTLSIPSMGIDHITGSETLIATAINSLGEDGSWHYSLPLSHE